jgi:hypothetical protein
MDNSNARLAHTVEELVPLLREKLAEKVNL